VIASSAMSALVIASSAIFALVTASVAILAVVTESSLGVLKLPTPPRAKIKSIESADVRALENTRLEPLSVKLVPGSWITPLSETIN
jgi:hypothetical protein